MKNETNRVLEPLVIIEHLCVMIQTLARMEPWRTQ